MLYYKTTIQAFRNILELQTRWTQYLRCVPLVSHKKIEQTVFNRIWIPNCNQLELKTKNAVNLCILIALLICWKWDKLFERVLQLTAFFLALTRRSWAIKLFQLLLLDLGINWILISVYSNILVSISLNAF